SCQASTECAWPCSCSTAVASITAGVIHVPLCPLRGSAQPAMTLRNAVSTRTSKRRCRTTRRKERDGLNSATNRTVRGSGLHHRIGWASLYQGKMPCRYAASSRAGDRSPPAASNPFGSSSAASRGGNGEPERSHGTTLTFCRCARCRTSYTACDEPAEGCRRSRGSGNPVWLRLSGDNWGQERPHGTTTLRV